MIAPAIWTPVRCMCNAAFDAGMRAAYNLLDGAMVRRAWGGREEPMADGPDKHHDLRERVVQEHEERLNWYQSLLAEIEAAAGEATIEADRTGPNTTSQFTDDIRYLIGISEALINRFRHRDDESDISNPATPKVTETP